MEKYILSFDRFLRLLHNHLPSPRSPFIFTSNEYPPVANEHKDKSVACLRINHIGEVCAQGLYQGQMLAAKNERISQELSLAAEQEADHLMWCLQRLTELGAKPSRLMPFWYMSSVMLGFVAGVKGDDWSLGFLEETERQVVNHLQEHIDDLQTSDPKSREIFIQMQKEEQEHQQHAHDLGARKLPQFVTKMMWLTSRVMVFITPKL